MAKSKKSSEPKKNVTEILMERIVKEARESGKLPWMTPWKYGHSFNYFTKRVYTGINRWLLPNGEYMTKNQINKYNKENGTKYLFKKGIRWFPILFLREKNTYLSKDKVSESIWQKYQSSLARGETADCNVYLGVEKYKRYYNVNGKLVTKRLIRVYHMVAERQFFVNEDGEPLPSKIETGEVEITQENPIQVIDSYMDREGIEQLDTIGEAWYRPDTDTIGIPPVDQFHEEEGYYSTFFHEIAHSSGSEKRLSREGVLQVCKRTKRYAKEEVIAELTAALLCAETGVMEYEPENSKLFESKTAYVQSWIKGLQDSEDDIVTLMSQADKAFKFITSDADRESDGFSEGMKNVVKTK